jgi:hypothetical protein
MRARDWPGKEGEAVCVCCVCACRQSPAAGCDCRSDAGGLFVGAQLVVFFSFAARSGLEPKPDIRHRATRIMITQPSSAPLRAEQGPAS